VIENAADGYRSATSNTGGRILRKAAAMDPAAQELTDDDHVLVHQFIRLFGRRPNAEELAQYRTAQTRIRHRLRLLRKEKHEHA
jgi:hypothetical protein